jgi:hypothetical protein
VLVLRVRSVSSRVWRRYDALCGRRLHGGRGRREPRAGVLGALQRSDGECHECNVDADCGPSEVCQGHDCQLVCSSDAECQNPARPVCNEATGACVGCVESADCPVAAPTCNQDGECVQCVTDGNCPANLPACKSGTCVECDGDQYCPPDRPNADGSTESDHFTIRYCEDADEADPADPADPCDCGEGGGGTGEGGAAPPPSGEGSVPEPQ